MKWRAIAAAPLLASLALGLSARADEPGPTLELKQGDHVTLIGNALAEGMQHDGWLEALAQRRYPGNQLVFRNLGFSGDELTKRQRSENFGRPDDWLKKNETDVVLAFFGYGESFAGPNGLEGFKTDLDSFIRHTLDQQYNGESAPRLVLVSPIAAEDLDDDDLPDAELRNKQLEPFAEAMAEAAKAHPGLIYVDVFHPTKAKFESSDEPLTTNGHYLNSAGNRFVAETIAKAIFPGTSASDTDEARLEPIRQAVVDKNFYWFNRYRTTDGYNVYGGRSSLAYTDGITNRVVMDREMEILDLMTANRDRRVWAVAQGGDLEVDDSNTPPFIPVKTNLPGPLPGGKHEFFGGEEAIGKMTVADGLEVQLVASEEQFPDLINPVQMAFDTQNRLWVATWPTYPHWTPKSPQNDKLLILEDTDGDGKADRSKVFADHLHCPTGFEFWNGGVIVSMAPDLMFLKDTDGDDVADLRVRILHGLDSADTHHTANSYVLAPDGALYFQEGTFHQSQIESNDGVHRNHNACVWRFEPRTGKVERYVPFDFANPHGHAFTRWGQDIIHDGTGSEPYHAVLFSGYLPFPMKHSRPPTVYDKRTRPCPATEVLASRHFPDDYQGNLLVENVIGFQGILRYRLEDKGSSLQGVEVEPILSSSDPKFRPVDLEVGPDGALYFTDWQNPIIGHMQHHIRDPNRDTTHGRVYRVVAKGRDLLTPPKIAGEPIPALLDLLKLPEDRVRYRTRIELSGRKTEEVVLAVNDWINALDNDDPEYAHNLLEALWVFQQHNVVNERLLDRVLALEEPRARAAAVRVLVAWRDRLEDPLGTLAKLAADEDPRVRLEAVRGASFFNDPDAVEIPFLTLEHPTDKYLDFTRDETLKALDRIKK